MKKLLCALLLLVAPAAGAQVCPGGYNFNGLCLSNPQGTAIMGGQSGTGTNGKGGSITIVPGAPTGTSTAVGDFILQMDPTNPNVNFKCTNPTVGGTNTASCSFNGVTFPSAVTPLAGMVANSSGAAVANAALINTACAIPNNEILLPQGVYYVSSIICTANGVSLGGATSDNVYGTKLIFVPTADAVTIAALTPNVADPGTAVLFAKNGGTVGNITFNSALHDLWITTTDLTYNKYAIRFIEQAEGSLMNVRVDGFYGVNSVGVQLAGHEVIGVDRSFFYASIPMQISQAPGVYSGTHYDCDSCTIWRSQFLSNLGAGPTTLPNADILIDAGVYLSNFLVDSVNLVGGQYGVYDVSAISSGASPYEIKFRNIRHEQPQGTPSYGYYFDNTGGSQIKSLSFDQIYNVQENGAGACWYFKGVILAVSISDSSCNAPASGYTVDDEDVVYAMTWRNMSSSTWCAGFSGPTFLKVPSGMVLSQAYCSGSNGPELVNGIWTRGLQQLVSITPAAGATNNLLPSDARFPNTVRSLSVNTVNCPCNFTGLSSTTASDGQIIRVDNIGANALTLNHQNAGSTVHNRFQAPGAVDYKLPANASVNLQFDQTNGYWMIVDTFTTPVAVTNGGTGVAGSITGIPMMNGGSAFTQATQANGTALFIPSADVQSLGLGTNALTQGGITGTLSTALGYHDLQALTSGIGNTAVGAYSLDALTGGTNNTAVGANAGHALLTGNYNVAVGDDSLKTNTAGIHNTAVGDLALTTATTSENTAVGYNALTADNTGANETAVGASALQANTSGARNTAVGFAAIATNSTGNDNTAVGYQALQAETGSQNTAVGENALTTASAANNNTGVGYGVLSIATGGDNTAIGTNAGNTITSGGSNIIIGENGNISSGSSNVIIGNSISTTTATGSAQLNIANAVTAVDYTVGPITLKGGLTTNGATNINASNNAVTNIGTGTTSSTVTVGGGSNAVTLNATTLTATGTVNMNVSNNTATNIGTGTTNALVSIGGGSNAVTIAASAGNLTLANVTTGTNADFVCMASGNKVTLQTSACTISSRRYKENIEEVQESSLDKLDKLQIVAFNMKERGQPNPDPNFKSRQVGLLAENVAEVAPECAVYDDDMKTPKSYRPECVIALLVKATQEQQREIQLLKHQLQGSPAIAWRAP